MDRLSKRILEEFSQRKCINLSQLGAILNMDCFSLAEPINDLRENGFLKIEGNYAALHDLNQNSPLTMDLPLVIAFQGRAALEEEKSYRQNLFWTEFRAWVTLAIAVVAFVKSFFF